MIFEGPMDAAPNSLVADLSLFLDHGWKGEREGGMEKGLGVMAAEYVWLEWQDLKYQP